MLALSWILGLTIFGCVSKYVGYCLCSQSKDNDSCEIAKKFTKKDFFFVLGLSFVCYSVVMLLIMLPLPRENYKVNKTITYSDLKSELHNYDFMFTNSSALCYGNSEAQEVLKGRAGIEIEGYKLKLGDDLYKHNNDRVDISVTSENSNCLKYFFCGGVENLYTADVKITDITKTCNFTGTITQQVYGGQKVSKVGDLYFKDEYKRIDDKYINKQVEVEIAYSELNSVGDVIVEYDIISAKEVI